MQFTDLVQTYFTQIYTPDNAFWVVCHGYVSSWLSSVTTVIVFTPFQCLRLSNFNVAHIILLRLTYVDFTFFLSFLFACLMFVIHFMTYMKCKNYMHQHT